MGALPEASVKLPPASSCPASARLEEDKLAPHQRSLSQTHLGVGQGEA